MKPQHKPNFLHKSIIAVLAVLLALVWILAFQQANAAVTPTADNISLTVQCANGRWAKGKCPDGQEPPLGYIPFLQFDNGSGTTWDGWTWSEDVAFGNPGWTLNPEGDFGGGFNSSRGYGPRSFNKGDYGADNTAVIDASVRSPSTSSGGSLKVYDTGTDNQATWWLWYDWTNMSDRGLTDTTTDRMSFYVKIDGLNPQVVSGVPQLNDGTMSTNVHLGTYLCWDDGGSNYGTGDGCPYEGPGNKHYYFYMSLIGETWIHAQVDQHATKLRGVSEPPSNNHSFAVDGTNYFETLHQFYLEVISPQSQPTSMWVDDFKFWTTANSPEPDQNDESIAMLWIGYNPSLDIWTFGFNDNERYPRNGLSAATYQIRYSTSPITNANWTSATIIQTEHYSKAAYTDDPNNFRKPKFWYAQAWDQFTLPDIVESTNNQLYFAIKDVSVQGQHGGSSGDHANGDLIDSVSSYVKTIDYILRSQ